MTISLRAPHKRPSLWVFRDPLHNPEVFAFLYRVALRAAVKKELVHEKDVLPNELVTICARISRNVTGNAFRQKANERIANYCKTKRKGDTPNALPIRSAMRTAEAPRGFVSTLGTPPGSDNCTR